ncbi:ribonuclease R [bacterium]|nr:ribonuclease R [bacterium]
MIRRILTLLKKNKQGLSLSSLARKLRLSSKERKTLKKKLRDLEKKGAIFRIKQKYFLSTGSPTIQGEFLQSTRGFGFVKPENEGMEDIFIPPPDTQGALEGDTVEILFRKKGKKGKPEGKVLRILKKNKKSLLGIYRERGSKAWMKPLDPPSEREMPVKRPQKTPVSEGNIVEVDRENLQLKSVWGTPDESGVDVQVMIHKYNLPTSFPSSVIQEVQSLSASISPSERRRRKDYRDWLTVTIDGEDARDFDDAVSIKQDEKGNYYLGVHIADVSHYVQPGSAVDKEAYRRGNSVYFPEKVIHMLPANLSTQVCSLRPQQERLTFSAVLLIDSKGNLLDWEFHPSVICTQARMTYQSVFKIFQGEKEEMEKYSHLLPALLKMRNLAGSLRERRIRKGGLDFDLPEPELVYKEGILQSVEPFETNEAHQLIEEFMLAANEAVASYLSQKNIPMLYRVHPSPSLKSLELLGKMLSHFDVYLPSSGKITQKELQGALAQVKGKAEEKFVTLQMLKSLQMAFYSEKNKGHYGLAKKKYTHFTSPIRRYPDLMVHRLLKKVLQQDSGETYSIPSIAQHCSERERKAADAEQDLVRWRIFRFLKGKLGEEMEGIIVDITKAGLTVELKDYFVGGTIPYGSLHGDYFFKKTEKTLKGKRTGRKFELGDKVRVTIASVDPHLKKMDFVLS